MDNMQSERCHIIQIDASDWSVFENMYKSHTRKTSNQIDVISYK
jgi:hypothetical protein